MVKRLRINRYKRTPKVSKSKSPIFHARGFGDLESDLQDNLESEQASSGSSFGYDFANIAIHRNQTESAISKNAELNHLIQRNEITFTEDEVPTIVGLAPGARSDIIDDFYANFVGKLGNVRDAFDNGLENFETFMSFPPEKSAQANFQKVFLAQIQGLIKGSFEQYLQPALATSFPGFGTALSLVTALNNEVSRAQKVAGELAMRDFLIQTRNIYGDAMRKKIDEFLANSAEGRGKAQKLWREAVTSGEQNEITRPMQEIMKKETPSAQDFQKKIVSAYMKMQQGNIEDRGFFGGGFTALGRIEVKYDEARKLESAKVQLQNGSGSAQIAEQINKLYGSPIDLRDLNTEISVGMYGDNLIGGKSYNWVVLQPPNFAPTRNFLGYSDYKRFPGDALKVSKVSG